MNQLIAPFFNVVVLVTILAYYLREPLKGFVKSRHQTLRDELEAVHRQLRLAQERYDEFTAKLKVVESEARALRDALKQDAQVASERIVSESRRLAGVLVTDARASSQVALRDFRGALQRELGQRVLQKAEDVLRARLTGADRDRLRKEFSVQMEKSS